MLALGVINIIRFGSELWSVDFWPASYLALIGIDMAGGVLAIAGGIGLMKPRRWGWNVTMSAWGAMIANASYFLWLCFDGGLGGEGLLVVIPRLLFFPLVLMLSAYGLWAVMMRMSDEKGSRAMLSLWFAAGAMGTAAAMGWTRL